MSKSNHKSRLKIESLESRHLLAADVLIQHDPVTTAQPGDEVTRVVRVFANNQTSVEVQVRASLGDELEVPTWTRRIGFGNEIAPSVFPGRSPDTIEPAAPTQLIPKKLSLGDVNGDGLEDFATRNIVELGSESGVVEVVFAEVFVGLGWVQPVGDVDNDGIDDFYVQSRLVYGHAGFGEQVEISVDERATLPGREILDGEISTFSVSPEQATPAGDLNNDGFQDMTFSGYSNWYYIVFGGPRRSDPINLAELDGQGFLVDARDTVSLPQFDPVHFSMEPSSGDVNGDGIDDLLLTFDGGGCFFGCSMDRDPSVGGSILLYGSEGIGTNGRFDASYQHTKHSITARPYTPVRTRLRDVNADGLDDIHLSTFDYGNRPVNYVIFGSASLEDIYFGLASFDYEALNGDSVWAFAGDVEFVDVNSDGKLDTVEKTKDGTNVFLGGLSLPSAPASGTGNIDEVIQMLPSTSLIYEITGTLNADNMSFESSVIPLNEADADLRNNLVSERSGVMLGVELTSAEVDAVTGATRVEFTITNDGPTNASIEVGETLTDALSEVEWKRTAQVFPTVIQLGELNGVLGSKFESPDPIHRASFDSPPVTEDDSTVYRYLGQSVGSPGDTDGDGFDEVFVQYSKLGPDSQCPIVFAGSTDFGASGEFSTEELAAISLDYPSYQFDNPLLPENARFAAGDFNGDGWLDSIVGDATANDGRGAVYVRLGSSDFDPTAAPLETPDDLDGQNGFSILSSADHVAIGKTVTTGDVNGDGLDDILVTDYQENVDSKVATVFVIFGANRPMRKRLNWPASTAPTASR